MGRLIEVKQQLASFGYAMDGRGGKVNSVELWGVVALW